MAKTGPRTLQKHSLEFKLKAVKMSNEPDVLIKDVAESLCIHPFMLSRWRKEVRDGVLAGPEPELDTEAVSELKRLRDIERQYKLLQQEHDLLKKAIRFVSAQKHKSSLSLKQTVKASRSK
jgi:transposase